jgi:thioredoxin 1
MPSAFRSVGEDDFGHEVLDSLEPVIVFFWDSSDPCRFFIPALEGFAAGRGEDAKLVKVNVEIAPGPAIRARLAATPALLLYRGGRVVDQIVGTCTREELEALFRRARGE